VTIDLKTTWKAGAVFVLSAMCPMSALAQDGAFVEAEGVDLAYQYCTGCHSEMLVAQQGQTREGWDKLFEWMVEDQGMQPIPEPDRTKVLDYLAEHYNTDRPNFPRP